MQYTYNIVEAAALWAGVDFSIVKERMDSADIAGIEAKYEEDKRAASVEDFEAEATWQLQRKVCSQCELEAQCPEGLVVLYCEDTYHLQCPQGFSRKPGDDPPASRTVTKRIWTPRLLPHPREFADLPRFEKRLEWLQAALKLGDLDGTPEIVRARDLRAWMQEHFPEERSIFLFPATAPRNNETLAEENGGVVRHNTGESSFALKRELTEAMKLAGSGKEKDYPSIWTELCKLAERQFGCLIEYRDGVVRYRGSRFEKSPAVPDTISRTDLPDKMRPIFNKMQRRIKAHDDA